MKKTSNRNLVKLIKSNLFSSRIDTLITLFLGTLIVISIWNISYWLTFIADWGVVTRNYYLYTAGSYPSNEAWRPISWLIILALLTSTTLIGGDKIINKKIFKYICILILPLGILLLHGWPGISNIPTRYWGGLTLTLILSLCSFLIALPLGIILAIGRQSGIKIIKSTSRSYIDAIRSIPLISVLFFGQLLIPLFLPIDMEINRVIRAIIAFSVFTSAYIAEDIRSGFQAIPFTQKEAAKALGLSKYQIFKMIILPQTLIFSLPALTNQAIGLLQNTSLMAILGLVELLGISRSILANPEFIGRYLEVYVWIAFIYWFVCTALAMLSKQLEKRFVYMKN